MSQPWQRDEPANGLLVQAARKAKVSPRIKMAARLYASGAVRTKREAAAVMRINPEWFTVMTNHNDEVRRLLGEIDQKVEDESISTSALLQELGRKAIRKINSLMTGADKEDIQLKAAIDLADRSPETSKIQRHQIESMTISTADAKELAKALVDAAQINQRFAEEVKGDYIRVVDSDTPQAALPMAQASPAQEPVGEGEAEEGQIHEAPEVARQ